MALTFVVLLAACTLPARAALVCQEFAATLAQPPDGSGCNSTSVSQVMLAPLDGGVQKFLHL
jgi:hypothetical protein